MYGRLDRRFFWPFLPSEIHDVDRVLLTTDRSCSTTAERVALLKRAIHPTIGQWGDVSAGTASSWSMGDCMEGRPTDWAIHLSPTNKTLSRLDAKGNSIIWLAFLAQSICWPPQVQPLHFKRGGIFLLTVLYARRLRCRSYPQGYLTLSLTFVFKE